MSMEKEAPSEFFIQAVESSEVFFLSRESQEQLFAKVPKMERYFRIILQKSYAALQQRNKYIFSLSKEKFYKQFSDGFPGFLQRVPQYMLASYLGMTPEYLSELRSKFP
jgi:CRP/FNR family transcriptional regulator, anaerobic regulatory protein